MMAFEGEVSAGDKMDFCIGQVALESFGSSRDERLVSYFTVLIILAQIYETFWNYGAIKALKVQKAGGSASFCHLYVRAETYIREAQDIYT
jgi:hypothetical protein